jgi:DNA polymerase (family 10)
LKLDSAVVLANRVLEALSPLCDRVEVAGSIRRQKPEVNDIDIVAIPDYSDYRIPDPFNNTVKTMRLDPTETWKKHIPEVLMKGPLKLLGHQFGQELMRFSFRDGFQVDIYRARPETWGVILLVRTGSKEHNVKLCSLARSKGWKLSASQGVVTQEGFGEVKASKTEEEIFAALGLPFVEPKDREV